MKYKNKKTGRIIDIPGVISGDVWEPIEGKTKPVTKEPETEPVEAKPEDKAPEDIKPVKKSRSKKK